VTPRSKPSCHPNIGDLFDFDHVNMAAGGETLLQLVRQELSSPRRHRVKGALISTLRNGTLPLVASTSWFRNSDSPAKTNFFRSVSAW
jgi:hypothetical protein